MTTTSTSNSPLRGRQRVRSLKRQMLPGAHASAAPEQREKSQTIIVELLERSIRFGHDRLALQRLSQAVVSVAAGVSCQRLSQAVDLGARLNDVHWKYCRAVAARSNDKALQEHFVSLALQHCAGTAQSH